METTDLQYEDIVLNPKHSLNLLRDISCVTFFLQPFLGLSFFIFTSTLLLNLML